VHCPFCGGPYTQASAKSGTVHYYVCHRSNARETKCPVRRINAKALHQAVLGEVRRAAQHHTVMHRLIAESGGWGTADGDLRTQRNQLSDKKQLLGMRIANYLKAIGEGRGSDAIFGALAKTEA